MKIKLGMIMCGVLFFLMLSCATRHEVKLEPVEIKPIHITIDVNVRIEKALDDFFSDVDKAAEKIEPKVQENPNSPKTK